MTVIVDQNGKRYKLGCASADNLNINDTELTPHTCENCKWLGSLPYREDVCGNLNTPNIEGIDSDMAKTFGCTEWETR